MSGAGCSGIGGAEWQGIANQIILHLITIPPNFVSDA